MSRKRQRTLRCLALNYTMGVEEPEHSHQWGQLLYAAEGALRVESPEANWVLPRNRSLWIPPGTRHRLRSPSPVQLRTLYFPRRYETGLPASVTLLPTSPLARELILHLVTLGVSDLEQPDVSRLVAVLLDLLSNVAAEAITLPIPHDAAARRVAYRVLDHPRCAQTLEQLAHVAALSRRTLERRFSSETGMSFREWRCQARIQLALVELANGRSVKQVARAVGYESTSAFVAMFRQRLGTTPGRFFGEPV